MISVSTPPHRFKDASLAAGYETARSAAEAFSWVKPTYYAHENGNKNYSKDAAKKYGREFRVNPAWLLFYQGAAESPMAQLPAFDSESLTMAFVSLLTTLVPDMDKKQAELLVGAALRLVELHHRRNGTKQDLDKLSEAVTNAAKLGWSCPS